MFRQKTKPSELNDSRHSTCLICSGFFRACNSASRFRNIWTSKHSRNTDRARKTLAIYGTPARLSCCVTQMWNSAHYHGHTNTNTVTGHAEVCSVWYGASAEQNDGRISGLRQVQLRQHWASECYGYGEATHGQDVPSEQQSGDRHSTSGRSWRATLSPPPDTVVQCAVLLRPTQSRLNILTDVFRGFLQSCRGST